MVKNEGQALLVISGPSGVGKTSVARALTERDGRLVLAVTSTTRTERPGELDGRDYHFLSEEEFDGLLKNDGFIEHVDARQARYGLTKAELERIWDGGHIPVLVLDPDGKDAVKALYPQAFSVFIDAPSAVVMERLLARGDTDVASRMEDNLKVWAARDGYDAVIGNEDDIRACAAKVQRAFDSHIETSIGRKEHNMPYDNRIPLRLQLLRAGLENADDTAIFTCATSTSYYTPSYFIGDAHDNPEMMDVMGALEGTLHDLIDNGCTLTEACNVMGLSELSDDDLAEDGQVYIDLGVGFDGELMSLEKLDPESSDIRSVLSEQQIVNVVMAFDNLEPNDRLRAAERFATGEYTGWEAQEVCEAYRAHLPEEALDAIADHKLKHSQIRALVGIAGITEPSPDGIGEPQRPALDAVLKHLDETAPKLHLTESLAETAHRSGVPFDERWCSLNTEQVASLRTAIAVHVPAEAIEAFAEGRYSAASMDSITVACCDPNERIVDVSPLLDPAYTPEQLWCLSSAVASHAQGELSDAQLDFLRNPELPADIMNAARNCFTYYGLTVEQAEQYITPGITPERVYDLLDNDKAADRTIEGLEERSDEPEHPGALSDEARASREASGRLETDLSDRHDDIGQEKE